MAVPDPRVEPRVYPQNGYAVTFWTYYEPVASAVVSPVDYASALHRLHGGMRMLATKGGVLFIDLETCCRGPVEFDLAHAPEEVGEHYPGVDIGLLRECRILVLAMITAWRWDRVDRLPNGRQLGANWLRQLRAALDSLDNLG